MEALKRFLKIFFFVQLGFCCGRVLQQYLDYVRFPERYMMQSAPWYTGILLSILFTAVTASLTGIAWWSVSAVLRKRRAERRD